MSDINKEIGTKIKYYRTKRGLFQDELAKRIEKSKSYISEIEAGRKNISAKLMVDIASVLKIEPKYLLSEIEDSPVSDEEKHLIRYYREWEKEGLTVEDIKRFVELAKKLRE